jgi:hypothetical protein
MMVQDETVTEPVCIYMSSLFGDNYLFKALNIIPDQTEYFKWLDAFDSLDDFQQKLNSLIKNQYYLSACVEV